LLLLETFPALNVLLRADVIDVPLRNYSLSHHESAEVRILL